MSTADRAWQGQGHPPVTPVVRTLVIVTLAAFVVQSLADLRTGGVFTREVALSLGGVLGQGRLWQLITYQFLHGGIFHVLFNMIVLHSFGRALEDRIGGRRFLALYLVSGVVGGIGWLAMSGTVGHCVGASGAVFGITAAFAAIEPERVLTMVIFPVPVPVTMKARTMVLVFGGISVLFLVLGTGNVAHAAHLSGGFVGYLYGRRVRLHGVGPELTMDDAPWRHRRGEAGAPDATDATPDPDEVDRILEKVRAQGLGSLTRRERDILDRASKA